MDNSNFSALPTQPIRVQVQSMEEFEREATESLARHEQLKRQTPAAQQPNKNIKPTISKDVLEAEKRAIEELADTNWIGRLLEYRNAHPAPLEGLKYVEEITNGSKIPRFTCKVTIFETPQQFGGQSVSFSNKKSSKQWASKKAIDWLIENGLMPDDGSVKFPKITQPVPTTARRESSTSSTHSATNTQSPANYASQVPPLCHRLGFNTPRYEIHPVIPNAPVYDAWADFGSDPRIEGKVGLVDNIHGKKNAKEAVARIVVSFLQDIERQRLAEFEEGDEEEKKRKRSMDSIGRDGDGKSIRIEG